MTLEKFVASLSDEQIEYVLKAKKQFISWQEFCEEFFECVDLCAMYRGIEPNASDRPT